MIHEYEIRSEGIEKSLEAVIQTSKDHEVLNHAELVLGDWRDELIDIMLSKDAYDEDDDIM